MLFIPLSKKARGHSYGVSALNVVRTDMVNDSAQRQGINRTVYPGKPDHVYPTPVLAADVVLHGFFNPIPQGQVDPAFKAFNIAVLK